MKFSAHYLAQILQGKVEGDSLIEVSQIAPIEKGVEGSLSFLANPKYTAYIYNTDASIVLVNEDFTPEKPVKPTLIRVKNAYVAFQQLMQLYQEMQQKKTGISSQAFIHQTAQIDSTAYIAELAYIGQNTKIGQNVQIYPLAFVGDGVQIDNNTIIYAGAKIYHNCIIGQNCIIHSGAIIGSDGFGFAPDQDNEYKKIPQLGNVIIEDNVEVGSNTTIDRATMGATIIRKGVKLDNLIQVAHNVEIGENTVIAAQTGISGSTKIGKNCMIGGQVGIVGHITIADEVKIAAQSGLNHSVNEKGKTLFGSPAFDFSQARKSVAIFRRLPELYRKISDLEKEIQLLKKDGA